MTPLRVLIVDDSPIIRDRLSEFLSDLPNMALVGKAEDGRQGETLFRQHRPDLVILDIDLPEIGGLDLLSQFKAEDPACIVVMLTSYSFRQIRQRCKTLGADYFFEKAREFDKVTELLTGLRAPTR